VGTEGVDAGTGKGLIERTKERNGQIEIQNGLHSPSKSTQSTPAAKKEGDKKLAQKKGILEVS